MIATAIEHKSSTYFYKGHAKVRITFDTQTVEFGTVYLNALRFTPGDLVKEEVHTVHIYEVTVYLNASIYVLIIYIYMYIIHIMHTHMTNAQCFAH